MRALIGTLIGTLRGRLVQDRGAVAVVVAVSMLALLGVGAVAVDSGRNWGERRQLVTAVEAAALAAAHDYSHGTAGCTTTAGDFLTRNHPDATMTDCDPNGDLARGTFGWVTISAEVEIDQFFGGVLGTPERTISATSSAMFGVPAVGAAGARPMALCYEAVVENALFKSWQANGSNSPAFSVPFTSSVQGCGSSPQVDCPIVEEVRELVNIFGDAYYDAERGEYILTRDEYYQRGAVMSDRRIDVSKDFAVAFDVYLGDDNNGADGIGFVFHNDPAGPSALGNNGGGLGMSGIKNSIGIEFDTWHNTDTFGPPPRVSGDSTPALTWNPAYNVTGRSDLAVGYRFSTDREQVVTHLGVYDSNGNGQLDNGDSTTVRLWTDNGGLLASEDIPKNTAIEADGFGYIELSSPITLPANRYYRVAAEARAGNEGFSYGGNASMAEGLAFAQSVWAWTDVTGFPSSTYNTYGYVGGTIKVISSVEDPNYPAEGTQAGDDVPQDHTAIYDPEHLIEPANYSTDPQNLVLYGASSRLSPLVTLPNIEDNQWHEASITWNAASNQLTYSFDGSTIGTLTTDLAGDHLGDHYAYFGFASSTGGAKNLHKLRFKTFDTQIEGGNPQCDAPDASNDGAGNWGLLDFDGGANSNQDVVDWIENGYSSEVGAGTMQGSPGALSGVHAAALNSLVASRETIALPLYSGVSQTGSSTILDIVAFVNVILTDFKVTGPSSGRYLEFMLVSSFENRACCIEIPTDGSYVETNQRATRVVTLNDDGTPKRS